MQSPADDLTRATATADMLRTILVLLESVQTGNWTMREFLDALERAMQNMPAEVDGEYRHLQEIFLNLGQYYGFCEELHNHQWFDDQDEDARQQSQALRDWLLNQIPTLNAQLQRLLPNAA